MANWNTIEDGQSIYFYVDKYKGSDANEGSANSPFATIQKAFQSINSSLQVAGNEVKSHFCTIGSGHYTQNDVNSDLINNTATLNNTVAINTGVYITIQGDSPNVVIEHTEPDTNIDIAFSIYTYFASTSDRKHIVVRNLELRGYYRGLNLTSSCFDRVSDCVFKRSGVSIYNNTKYIYDSLFIESSIYASYYYNVNNCTFIDCELFLVASYYYLYSTRCIYDNCMSNVANPISNVIDTLLRDTCSFTWSNPEGKIDITTDPLYLNPLDENFALSEGSPLANASHYAQYRHIGYAPARKYYNYASPELRPVGAGGNGTLTDDMQHYTNDGFVLKSDGTANGSVISAVIDLGRTKVLKTIRPYASREMQRDWLDADDSTAELPRKLTFKMMWSLSDNVLTWDDNLAKEFEYGRPLMVDNAGKVPLEAGYNTVTARPLKSRYYRVKMTLQRVADII